MRIPWWQSIRWRLALGSMLVALLAVTLLALAAIFSVTYYYSVEQRASLDSLAAESAQQIGANYPSSKDLSQAAALAFSTLARTQPNQNQGYAAIVLNRFYDRVYPLPIAGPQRALAGLPKATQSRVRLAAIKAQQGIATDDDLSGGLVASLRPFVAEPIHEGGQSSAPVIGVLIMIPRSALSNTASPFLATTSQFVLIASLIVAVLAAIAAILFSRTITRPLAKMTNATRVLASRNYSARVQTGAQSELGELARTFNEMAARLEYDVNELHRQELWRRELIMNITQDLHMMAKVEAGELRPQRKAIRLAALVDEVLAVLATEFERANVEPRNMIAYDVPVFNADPDMLTRVFTNLCDNALRYTPAGGAVTIDATRHGDLLGISVTDTGPGIPPAALPRLFDRFYRVDVSRQLATGGSGLGLAIVRAIIEAHGGTIWAENSPQGGARIVFTLPLT